MCSSDSTPYEKVGKNEPVSIADEVPFEIPESWEWCRLGMISTYAHTKKKVNAKDANPEMWGLDLEDIEKGGRLLAKLTVKEHKAIGDKTYFEKGDILYSKLRPYLLKILIADEDGICTPEIVPFKVYGKIDSEYIVAYLKSPYVDSTINAATYGIKMPRAGTETMTSLLVPVPPLSEQSRIVHKLKELNPFMKKYDTCEQSLASLNSEFPEQLKKSILQLAVQGKLVPQDPSDVPASVLLERIHAEKERLIAEGKIKRDKNESVIYRRDNSHYEKLGDIERCIDDELPFEVPESWAWVHVGDIFLHNTGKAMNSSAKQNDSSGQIRPFITTSNVYWNSFDFSNVKEMFFTTEEYKRCSAIKNDILICEGGAYYGRTAIWKYDYDICFQNHVHRLRSFLPLVPEFFYYMFRFYRETGLIQSKGTAMPGLSSKVLHELRIPLPPLPEQIRIVSQIEAILPMVKSL